MRLRVCARRTTRSASLLQHIAFLFFFVLFRLAAWLHVVMQAAAWGGKVKTLVPCFQSCQWGRQVRTKSPGGSKVRA